MHYRLALDTIRACDERELEPEQFEALEEFGRHPFDATDVFSKLSYCDELSLVNVGPVTPPFQHIWMEARTPELERPHCGWFRFWFVFCIERITDERIAITQMSITMMPDEKSQGDGTTRATCTGRPLMKHFVDLDPETGRCVRVEHIVLDTSLRPTPGVCDHGKLAVTKAFEHFGIIALICLSLSHRKDGTKVYRPFPHRRNGPTAKDMAKAKTHSTYSRILLPTRSQITSGGTSRTTESNAEDRRAWFVRGHWRHYKDHQTFIREYICGNPDLGWVKQEYLLKSLADNLNKGDS